MLTKIKIPASFLQQIQKQAEKEYPEECCGLIFGPAGAPEKLTRIFPCRNVQNEYHKKDPDEFPRTAKNAYFVAPPDLLAAQKMARAHHEELRVIYHSHIDAGAYFSEEDQKIATNNGNPVYPGVFYLVAAVQNKVAGESKLYAWDPSKKQFTEKTS